MKATIVTPYYEGKNYLNKYLDVVAKNISNLASDEELEVIIVNDSPWEKVEIFDDNIILSSEEISHKYPWLIIIDNKENLGIQQSRINGINRASGEYIMMLDQDDLIKENAVHMHFLRIKEYFEKNENDNNVLNDANKDNSLRELFFTVSNAELMQKNRTEVWYRSDYHKKLIGDLKTYIEIGTQIISPGQCMIPKNIIPEFWKNNICKKNGADDYFLWLLLLADNVKALYIDEPLYTHVFTEKNISADTAVTDESCFEFINYLYKCGYFKNEDADTLKKMLEYKAEFRRRGRLGKILSSLKNIGLFKANLKFKKKADVPYGFNR